MEIAGTMMVLLVSAMTVYVAARLHDGKHPRLGRPLFWLVTLMETGLFLLMAGWHMLPALGASYVILMALSYFYDVASGKYPAEESFLKVLWFLCYPPQLLMGPIGRFDRMKQTLFSPKLTAEGLLSGAERLLWGLFKKLVIADRIAPVTAHLAGDPKTYDGVYVLLLMLCYAVQLYADFTGGIDLVLGISKCFGIVLDENFKSPYFATSLKDYWRRWHITMASWFREYVFYPLGTGRMLRSLKKAVTARFGVAAGRRVPVYLASLLVWILTGLWHGFNANCLLWGLLNFLILMISYEWENAVARRKEKPAADSKGIRVLRILWTFFLVSALRLFDVYDTVGETFRAFASLFTLRHLTELSAGLKSIPLGIPDLSVLLAGTGVMILTGFIKRKGTALRPVIIMLLFFSVLIFGVYGPGYDPAGFIYQR